MAAAGSEAAAEPAEAQRLLLNWYDRSARDLPWRRSRDPYAILVSEVMLQQTQVDRVIPKYEEFLARFPDFASLAEASTADVIRAWSGLGYNRRAVNLQRLARVVVERLGGSLPEDPVALRHLPGLGRYTAAALACFAFGKPVPVVDTNVRRVLSRLAGRTGRNGGKEARTPSEIERLAAAYLPAQRAGDWNQAIMDLGATICRAAAPACLICPLHAVCPSRGMVVRDARATYSAQRAAPFTSTDRFLRGRIVQLLAGLPSGGSLAVPDLPARLSLAATDAAERLTRLLADLQREGLVARDPNDLTRIRLPM